MSYRYNNLGLEIESKINSEYFKDRVSKTYYDSLNREIKSEIVENNNAIIITTYTE